LTLGNQGDVKRRFWPFFWSYQQVREAFFENGQKFGMVFAVDFPKMAKRRVAAMFWTIFVTFGNLRPKFQLQVQH